MREIKFRGFNGKDIVYWDTLSHISPSLWSNEIGDTLMQFTGLKDNNGVEIYEGDIIEYFRMHGTTFSPDHSKRRVIEWSENQRCVGYNFRGASTTNNSYWEVIGNIYGKAVK